MDPVVLNLKKLIEISKDDESKNCSFLKFFKEFETETIETVNLFCKFLLSLNFDNFTEEQKKEQQKFCDDITEYANLRNEGIFFGKNCEKFKHSRKTDYYNLDFWTFLYNKLVDWIEENKSDEEKEDEEEDEEFYLSSTYRPPNKKVKKSLGVTWSYKDSNDQTTTGKSERGCNGKYYIELKIYVSDPELANLTDLERWKNAKHRYKGNFGSIYQKDHKENKLIKDLVETIDQKCMKIPDMKWTEPTNYDESSSFFKNNKSFKRKKN